MTPTLRPYLAILGATLLAQGLVSWALDWSGRASNQLPNRFANSDPRHAFIHVAWGAVMLVLVARGLDAAAPPAWRSRSASSTRPWPCWAWSSTTRSACASTGARTPST